MKTSLRILAALIPLSLAVPVAAQVAVVTSAKSGIPALTQDQVAGLFTGRNDKLPDGANVVLIDQDDAAPVREQFYAKATGKSLAQVKSAWSRLVFSGKAMPPKVVKGNDEVKKQLAAQPQAIGYIDKSAVDGSVKVLLSVD